MTTTATRDRIDGTAEPRTMTVVMLGALAGALAGLAFLLVSVWFTDSIGMPGKMPLMMMAAMVQGESSLMDGSASPILGALIHAVLSVGFGIAFGLLVTRLRATPFAVASLGIVYGVALYLVNFQVIDRAVFGWFADANQPFELVVHVVFGSLVALPFIRLARARR